MNNYSLCAFPISMTLHVSHLLQLKLVSSVLFNFSPSKPHSASEHLPAFLQIFGSNPYVIWWQVLSTAFQPGMGAPQIIGQHNYFYSNFYIHSYNSICLFDCS